MDKHTSTPATILSAVTQIRRLSRREASLTEAVRVLTEALERATKLASLVTVRQVIAAGDDAMDAAGLNPWAMNEGLATGDETISVSQLRAALTTAKELTK